MAHPYHLDQTFVQKTATHEFSIRWTRLGNPDAPAVVFIHGTPWSNVVWQNLASCLISRYSVYLYDHPGFGVSPPPHRLTEASDQDSVDLDASLTLRAEASAALFKHWNLSKPPHVVAHDNGGLVSLRLLLDHGIEYASLCLIDVVAIGRSGSGELPFFKLVAENEGVFKAIPPNLVEGFMRSYVKNATHKPMSKDIEDALIAPYLPGGPQGPDAFLKEMIQAHHRNSNALEIDHAQAGSKVQVQIMWGKDDAWVPVETAQRLKQALNTKNEPIIIEEAGHLVHYDQPSKLALEVGLWLNSHNSR